MSKQCQVCKTINHSAANHCSICGNELPDKELSEEEKLYIELHEAKITIQGLNKALFEMQKKIDKSGDLQIEIDEYKEKLTKERKESSNYANLLSKKEKDLVSIVNQLKNSKNTRNIWITSLFVVCVILGLSLMSLSRNTENYAALKTKCISLEDENSELLQKLGETENTKDDLMSQIASVSSYCPIVIKSIEIGNIYADGSVETDYGSVLYSSNSMYLQPKIEFIGLKETTVKVYVKIFKDGELKCGSSSPIGYTFDSEIDVQKSGNAKLSGWGNMTKRYWTEGLYRYEVWYNDMCLKSLNFTLY